MSSFVVDYKDVDNVLILCRNMINRHNTGIYFTSEFERLFGVVLPRYDYNARNDLFTEIGKKILRLNIDAVNGRYNENDNYTYADEYKFNDNLKVSDMQGLKSLHCIIYQCSEEGTDNQELYKRLVDLKNKIQYYLLSCTQEYEEATWGDTYEFTPTTL